jgi:Rad3-related DNA helicase
VDEAHQAPEFFRKAFSSEMYDKQAEQLEKALQNDWRIKFPEKLKDAYKYLFGLIGRMEPGVFETNAGVEKTLVEILAYFEDLRAQFKKLSIMPDEDLGPEPSQANPLSDISSARNKSKVVGAASQISRLAVAISVLLDAYEGPVDYRAFVEQKDTRQAPRLTVYPLEVGPLVAPALMSINKCVFTSGTLRTADGFGFAIREMGLHPSQVRIQAALPHVFDYKNRSGMWVTTDCPMPDKANKYDLLDKQAKEIHELCTLMRGGGFVINSSYSDVNALFERVSDMAYRDRDPATSEKYYHPIKQQSANIEGVVEQFKSGYNNVLFGVKGIAEGVDIPGLQLRLVIITRLLFPHFLDPLNTARRNLIVQRLVESGKSEGDARRMAFDQLDVQLAGRDLAQSAGRLIRTETDLGILAILDPRMHPGSKNYTNALRKLLPHPPFRTKADLLQALKAIEGASRRAQAASRSA